MSRFHSVIFDLDGTLIDSAPDLAAACNVMLRDLALPGIDTERATGFVGNGVDALVRRVLHHSGALVDDALMTAAIAAFLGAYNANLVVQTRPYPGVMAMLTRLAEADLALAICTNKPEAPARKICAALELTQFFPVIVGGDTLAVKKPDPAPLDHAIATLGGAADRSLYVGDTDVDHTTARAAKVEFAFFNGGYQRADIPDFAPDFRLEAMGDILKIAL